MKILKVFCHNTTFDNNIYFEFISISIWYFCWCCNRTAWKIILCIYEKTEFSFILQAILCSMFLTAMPRPAPRSRPERSPSLHKRIQLAHKHGSLVAILPNGRICISHDSKDKNSKYLNLWIDSDSFILPIFRNVQSSKNSWKYGRWYIDNAFSTSR